MDKSKQQEHSESSSAQIPKQEQSTKHAVKKDLEHLNTVRLVTRRVSTGNKEHSRKKHSTDQERRRARRKRGGKKMSLNLAPSVQEEEKRGEKIESRQEEIGKEREEITVVRSVSLSRSYLSFRCNYIRGRTNRRVEYQFQGDLKSGQLQVETRTTGHERSEERKERGERKEEERDCSRRWKQLGLSVSSDVEDWRQQTLYTSSEESTEIESEDSSTNSSICDDVITDDDVIKFKEGDVTSVRRVRSLAPFQALPINVITYLSDTYVAQVSAFSDSDTEDESAQLDQQHVEKHSVQHVLNNLTQHVYKSGRETGMFIKNGRLDRKINSDVAYKHFPHFCEKGVWVKPPMFRNFL